MILDHEWMAAAIAAGNALTEHGTGNLSLGGLILWILIREVLPALRRKRNNPGNSSLSERVLALEGGIGEVKEACARADERWIAQAEHNKRMEKQVEKIYERIDKVAGG